MIVDFFLPQKKIVLELQGPVHYLKPDLKEINLITKFKEQCIDRMGYKLVSVPYNAVSLAGVSLDYFIIQHINDN